VGEQRHADSQQGTQQQQRTATERVVPAPLATPYNSITEPIAIQQAFLQPPNACSGRCRKNPIMNINLTAQQSSNTRNNAVDSRLFEFTRVDADGDATGPTNSSIRRCRGCSSVFHRHSQRGCTFSDKRFRTPKQEGGAVGIVGMCVL